MATGSEVDDAEAGMADHHIHSPPVHCKLHSTVTGCVTLLLGLLSCCSAPLLIGLLSSLTQSRGVAEADAAP